MKQGATVSVTMLGVLLVVLVRKTSGWESSWSAQIAVESSIGFLTRSTSKFAQRFLFKREKFSIRNKNESPRSWLSFKRRHRGRPRRKEGSSLPQAGQEQGLGEEGIDQSKEKKKRSGKSNRINSVKQ
jgi:hypothetical protein